MTPTRLRDIITACLPGWAVTINEQEMLNVQADAYEKYQGFAYVEEMAKAKVSFAKFGKQVVHTHDVYFCVLGEFANTAEEREAIREERILPAVNSVEAYLNRFNGVTDFAHDYEPRGFDANEILIHIRFQTTEQVC